MTRRRPAPPPPPPAAAVKHYDPATRLALVRAPGARAADVRAAVALTKAVKKRPAALHVLQVAGSARTLAAYLRHWQATLAVSAVAPPPVDAAFLDALDADLDAGAPPPASRGAVVARAPAR